MTQTYLDHAGILRLTYRDHTLAAGAYFEASWTDVAGGACKDLLCSACLAEYGWTYDVGNIRPTELDRDETCHYCMAPIIDRPATLKEFCNIYSE